MRKLLREPLLHFLLLGVLLFVVYGYVSEGEESEQGRIVVTEGQVASLATTFARTWQRMPTEAELEGLISGYIREEVLYREGVALGLDLNDPVIRRRVVQKLQFVEESEEVSEPGEVDLQAYLDSNPEVFATQPRFSFRQVFIDPEKRGPPYVEDAERLLAELQLATRNAPANEQVIETPGDPTMLPMQFENAEAREVNRVFGPDFTRALEPLAVGEWTGPVRSGWGLHLVYLSERQEARVPLLAEVQEAVRSEWERERRLEESEAFYQQLLARYTVVVEESGMGQAGSAAVQ